MNSTLRPILEMYKLKFGFDQFYDKASLKLNSNSLIKSTLILAGENTSNSLLDPILIQIGDTRIDLPIWFGGIVESQIKVVVLGREPRHNHNRYNIERSGRNVFGTPFGIEFWSERNKYFRSFQSIISNPKIFTYFTDVVKHYNVNESKFKSDKEAKREFWRKAELDQDNLALLRFEINQINPDLIVGLGVDCNAFLEKHFSCSYYILKLNHPNARQDKRTGLNAWEKIDQELKNVIINSKLNGG